MIQLEPGKNDTYTLEIVFMDMLIASTQFKVGDTFEEGDVKVITDRGQLTQPAHGTVAPGVQTLEEELNNALEELNSLTGLENIKIEVNEMVRLVKFYQETGKDILNKFSLHTVFTGVK